MRGFDVRQSLDVKDSLVGDIADFGQLRTAMNRIDVVVHLAATPDDDDFITRLLPNNVVGLYNVLEGARVAGVRRVILASSGQVVRGHEGPWPATPDMLCSPRNWYAAAKVLAEAAGQVYAHTYGLSVIAVRFGWCPRDKHQAEELADNELGKDVYLSPGDAGRMVVCAWRLPSISNTAPFLPRANRCTQHATTSRRREPCSGMPEHTWPQGLT